MSIKTHTLINLLVEQYRHDKLSLLIEDSLDNGLFYSGEIPLNDSNSIFILLDIIGIETINDKDLGNITKQYQNDILYTERVIKDEEDLLILVEKFLLWLFKYFNKDISVFQ